MFFTGLTVSWSVNLLAVTPLQCISMTNQECKVRQEIVNVNSDEPVFYLFSIKASICRGSSNNINDTYTKICAPDVVKNFNVKLFNLMSRTDETRHIEWHETCKCKCRLDASVCNNKQRWNDDKYRCECNELIDKSECDKGSIWNPCNCECDKLCDVGEYLDYENCKCRKKLVDKLIVECTENIDKAKNAECNSIECSSIKNIYQCRSCTLHIVFFSIIFTINIGIATYFVYYKDMNCNKENASIYDYAYQATNY